jgi:hypothetical protein
LTVFMCTSDASDFFSFAFYHLPIQQGTQAIKAGKLEEAQTHYTAAKKASADVASHRELVAQIEALRASLEEAQQNRIKDAVLDLIEDARRELGYAD